MQFSMNRRRIRGGGLLLGLACLLVVASPSAAQIDTPEERVVPEADDEEDSGPSAAEVAEWAPDDWDDWRPPRRLSGTIG